MARKCAPELNRAASCATPGVRGYLAPDSAARPIILPKGPTLGGEGRGGEGNFGYLVFWHHNLIVFNSFGVAPLLYSHIFGDLCIKSEQVQAHPF